MLWFFFFREQHQAAGKFEKENTIPSLFPQLCWIAGRAEIPSTFWGNFWEILATFKKQKYVSSKHLCYFNLLGNSGKFWPHLKNKNHLGVANIGTDKSLVPRGDPQNISSCSSALDFLGFSLNSGVQGEFQGIWFFTCHTWCVWQNSLFLKWSLNFSSFILWLSPQIYFWLLHLFFPNTVKKS